MKRIFISIFALTVHFLMAQKYQVVIDSMGYNCSFRGLCAVSNKICWVTGSKGTVGKTTDGGLNWKFHKLLDSTKSEIRDIQAWDEYNAIILSVKDPAQILKTSDGGITWKPVFTAISPHTFLNSFAFWDRNKGIAFGDPINGHFEILTTTNGGDSWQMLANENLPSATKDEAGFAASGTSICVGKKGIVWFGTGGNDSHVIISYNYGTTWQQHETQMDDGIASKGVMSVAFFDEKNGVVVGGDFTAPDEKDNTYSVTSDGGLSWLLPDKHQHPNGYRSCVEVINKGTIMAVGINGIDISHDGGYNWEVVSNIGFLTIDKSAKGTSIFVAGTNVLGRLVPIK